MSSPLDSLAERFWGRAERRSDDECWPFLGFCNREGYGRFYDRRLTPPTSQAHRVAYELEVGPIPDGLTIDHLCGNPGCVNPAHMEPVPNGVNAMRGNGRAATQARQTHCTYGHEFTDENTTFRKDGSRECRACMRRRSAEKRRREKAHYAALVNVAKAAEELHGGPQHIDGCPICEALAALNKEPAGTCSQTSPSSKDAHERG